jgi:hypothetical protein
MRRNNTGVFNSRHSTIEYMRELRLAPLPASTPAPVTVESIAEQVAEEYETALKILNSAKGYPGMFAKWRLVAEECERKLTLLADYANDVAEMGVS